MILAAVVLAVGCAPPWEAHRLPAAGATDGAVADDAAPPADPEAGPAPDPVASCTEAVPWTPDVSYTAGNKVTRGSPMHLYQCRTWPNSGWCANQAYEPGKDGAPWTDAWVDLGRCP